MAGTLTISQLSDGTNSTSSTNCIQGSAKAWVAWTGATGAVRSSYNVSSVTRNGTGDYTINFSNALADANYAVSASARCTGSQYLTAVSISYSVAPTSSALRVSTGSYNTVYTDEDASVSVFR